MHSLASHLPKAEIPVCIFSRVLSLSIILDGASVCKFCLPGHADRNAHVTLPDGDRLYVPAYGSLAYDALMHAVCYDSH